MKTLHRRCAGLDVHSDSVVACVRLTVRTKASHEVRRFSMATRDLLELADWLAAQGVTHVAMEEARSVARVLAPEMGQLVPNGVPALILIAPHAALKTKKPGAKPGRRCVAGSPKLSGERSSYPLPFSRMTTSA